MSKINVEIDTTEKTMSVSVNGKKLDKVRNIYAYYDEDIEPDEYGRMRVELMMADQVDDDITRITRLVAADSEAGKQALKEGDSLSKTVAGFVEIPGVPEIFKEIHDFFG